MSVTSEFLSLHPFVNNVIIAVLTLVYIQVVMEIAAVIRDKLGYLEVSRKTIHIAASSWLLFWPLFDTSHWSWRLNCAIPMVYFVKILYLALVLKDRNNKDIRNMSRSGDPMELLFGPLQFVVIMLWLGLVEFMTLEATVIMAALGIGDGIAPLVGKSKYANHDYRVPYGSPKTLEGTIGGMFCGTIVGCYIYPPLLGFGFLPWQLVVALSAIAAAGEGTAPFTADNLVVPAVIHFSMDRLLDLLG